MSTTARRTIRSETAVRVLDIAERLAQTRGFNGFSYADIAAQLDITKASLHYHFASKAELGSALIVRYAQRFSAALAQIETVDPRLTLRSYVQLYEKVLVRDEMCLCGMFAAECSTLPARMQAELKRFFDANDAWLVRIIERGGAEGSLHFDGTALAAARTLTAGLEGAMLLSRSYREPARFAEVSAKLLAALVGVASPVSARGGRLRPPVPARRSRGRARAAAS